MADMTVWFIRIEGVLILCLLALLYGPSRHLIVRTLTSLSLLNDPIFRDCRGELLRCIWTGKWRGEPVGHGDDVFWKTIRRGFGFKDDDANG